MKANRYGQKKKMSILFKKYLPIYIMALPGLIYLFINNYMPLPGLVLAFKNYNARKGIWGSDWVGFDNFKFLFATNDAFIITRNTLCYNKLLGMEPISWYMEKKYWPFILVLVNLWKTIGYNCIIYLAAILGFDKGYYEAAAIDGAGKWQQIIKITIPLLRPTIVMMTLLAVGKIFYSDFGLFYQVPQNSGALFSVTNTIDTYVYRGLLELGDITLSAAAGLYQSVIGFILVLGSNLWVRRLDPDSSLF